MDIHQWFEQARNEGRITFKRLTQAFPKIAKQVQDKALRNETGWAEELWYYLFPKSVCAVCGKRTQFHNFREGNRPNCSLACRDANPATLQRQIEVTIERHGVAFPLQSNKSQKKFTQTMKSRYGGAYTLSSDLKNKAQHTVRKRYGVSNVAQSEQVQTKMRKTMLSRYGVESPQQSSHVRRKTQNTNLDRYGVTNPSQNPEVLDSIFRATKRYKKVTIAGTQYQLMGYEPQVLEYLIQRFKLTPEQIKTRRSEIPQIRYMWKRKQRVYFPDLYVQVKSIWWLVEVKSPYTLLSDYEQNKAKFERAKQTHPIKLIVRTQAGKIKVFGAFPTKKAIRAFG